MVRLITSIRGGCFDDCLSHPGAIWVAPLGGEILSIEDGKHNAELVVEGYPEVRSIDEQDRIVLVKLVRPATGAVIIHLVVRLSSLHERPFLAYREVADGNY